MKRPSTSIGGRPIDAAALQASVSKASADWLRSQREEKVVGAKRRHRALSQEAKEEKAKATELAAKRRRAAREDRELNRLLARIGYLSRRAASEAEAMLRVRCGWNPSAQPKVQTVCPHSLYSRLHSAISAEISEMKRSRIAGDGFKNVVLRKITRGYGRKANGTREYRAGEAADLARYILREEGLEPGIRACFSNVLEIKGANALYETTEFSIDHQRCAQIVGFWKALEAFEKEADDDGNVFSHLIIPMPHELSPEGRSRALEDFCSRLDEIHLPFVAALHQPDADGDQRNYHAHIIFAPRPFAIEGTFAWSFEAGKATELNLGAGIGWLREQVESAFNHALEREGNPLRYTAVPMAKRGVPASGETHDGPAVTAKKRKDLRDHAEREKITRQLVSHVARADARQAELGAQIEALADKKPAVPAPAVAQLPSALAALRERFPDPLRLKLLSDGDFADFSEADYAADRWYGPALSLAEKIRDESFDLVRDGGGQPELAKEKLPPDYETLIEASAFPDIVLEAISYAHTRLVREWERKRDLALIREDRMTWLSTNAALLFDERRNILPEYRPYFPPEVLALEGIQDAMIACHQTAQRLETRRIEEQKATGQAPRDSNLPESPSDEAVDPFKRSAEKKNDTRTTSPPSSQPGPAPSVPQEEVDEEWELLLLRGLQSGKIQTPGGSGPGR